MVVRPRRRRSGGGDGLVGPKRGGWRRGAAGAGLRVSGCGDGRVDEERRRRAAGREWPGLGWAELCRRERQGPNGSRRFVPEHTWELERAHTTRGNARQPAQVGQQPAELQARTEYGIQRRGRPSWPTGQTAVHETSSAPACQDGFLLVPYRLPTNSFYP